MKIRNHCDFSKLPNATDFIYTVNIIMRSGALFTLAIAHETNNNLYTTLTVNDHGSVHIWNRYTNGETPTLYDSEGNGDFYDQVADIVSRENDRERNLTTKNKMNFEYKSETPQGTSIIEIRSENGKLIADLNDIKKGSVELVTDETGHPNLKLQFIDKEFVYHFTKAHMGEMTHLYVDGELIASPMIMQPLLTNELIIAGDFDKVSIGEIISIIND